MEDYKRNYYMLLERINDSTQVVGRNPNDITVVAVSKTFPAEVLKQAYNSGIRIFGENRVQELVEKQAVLPDDIKWHLIGHLQRNKVKYIIDFVDMIHSLDSIELAEEIEKSARNKNKTVQSLVQVNISGEDTKFGISPGDTLEFLKKVSEFTSLKIKGLMTIGPNVTDTGIIRESFKKMHSLYIDIKQKNLDNINMEILSMGMSNDFDIAIQEGSNMVRIGSAIFGKRL